MRRRICRTQLSGHRSFTTSALQLRDHIMPSAMESSSGIKAMTTEENGEISCSVDETNRIRALLGLKPLNDQKGGNEKAAVDNFNANREKLRK